MLHSTLSIKVRLSTLPTSSGSHGKSKATMREESLAVNFRPFVDLICSCTEGSKGSAVPNIA